MLRERAAQRKLGFSALGRALASILVALARSQALQGALSGVPGRPWRFSGHSRRAPGTLRDAPETLCRRLRDALACHGVSREGPRSDSEWILDAPGRLRGSIFGRFSLSFSIDFASELSSKRDDSRRLGALSETRCKAKKPDGARAIAIAGRSSLLDESERASEKQTYMTDTRCKAKKLDGERATDIAGRSSLLDLSERARNRNRHTS